MHKCDGRVNQRGVVLVAAVCITFVVLALGLAAMSAATYELKSTRRAADVIVGRNVAEAGADLALWQLKQDPTWRCAGSPAAFTNAPLTTIVAGQTVTLGQYTVQPITMNADGTINVSSNSSTGTAADGAQKSIRVAAYPEVASMFPGAVVAKSTIALGGGADAYDSNQGTYKAPGNGLVASVMTTTGTTTSALSYGTIYGTAVYGCGTPASQLVYNGTIKTWKGTAWVTATNNAGVLAASGPVAPSDVTVPSGLVNLGNISGGMVIPAGTYTCNSISVKGNSSVTTAGPVILYCTGVVEFKGKGSMYPASGKPADLQIYCTPSCTSVTLCGNGNTTACIYAPEAAVGMNGGGNSGALYGSIVGNTVNFNGNHTWVHYDVQLGNLKGTTPIGYSGKAWEEIH